ncbi:WhiB family redox-sensing transcriptional regulator [Actinopolyspora biskrensis]|uniref:Transcriptional regulator WhiB n=1 Tax=Actinopolyspora biskrensis TaxID=1470178 RepID=A0A852Z0G4_9ACTN|nr:WhiB family transcriptional regulator [Actinopolyspora biskrensis]NYH77146.1 WhiB family redox-sensing transcriptional regulator [Actinopolyspora biskrensis]
MTSSASSTPGWEQHAACAGTPIELWYGPDDRPESGHEAYWRRRHAKTICARCPVRTECLADELTQPRADQHGIRGGTTPREREQLLVAWRRNGLVPADKPASSETVRRLLTREVINTSVS